MIVRNSTLGAHLAGAAPWSSMGARTTTPKDPDVDAGAADPGLHVGRLLPGGRRPDTGRAVPGRVPQYRRRRAPVAPQERRRSEPARSGRSENRFHNGDPRTWKGFRGNSGARHEPLGGPPATLPVRANPHCPTPPPRRDYRCRTVDLSSFFAPWRRALVVPRRAMAMGPARGERPAGTAGTSGTAGTTGERGDERRRRGRAERPGRRGARGRPATAGTTGTAGSTAAAAGRPEQRDDGTARDDRAAGDGRHGRPTAGAAGRPARPARAARRRARRDDRHAPARAARPRARRHDGLGRHGGGTGGTGGAVSSMGCDYWVAPGGSDTAAGHRGGAVRDVPEGATTRSAPRRRARRARWPARAPARTGRSASSPGRTTSARRCGSSPPAAARRPIS